MFTTSLLQKIEHIVTIFAWYCFLTNWHSVFPEDITLVPKHVGESHLMFVVIRNYAVG